MSKSNEETKKRGRPRKKHEANKVVIEQGNKCPNCGERFGHKVTNTYNGGTMRRIVCASCLTPFIIKRP